MARKSKGRLYRRGTSETWYLEYFVNGKKMREALRDPETLDPITDKKVAEKMRKAIIEPLRVNDQAAKMRALVARAEQADDSAARVNDVMPAAAWEMFRAAELMDASESTAKDYRSNWAKFEGFWSRGLGEFDDMAARQFAASLNDEKLSAGRFNKILNLVDRVFECATDSRPLQVIKRRSAQAVGRRELSESEIFDVIEAAADSHPVCGPELRVMLLIGIYTGLRLVDAVMLNVKEVDFENDRLMVTPRKTRRKGKHLVIPLHAALRTELDKLVPDMVTGDMLPELARKYRLDPPMVTRLVTDVLELKGIDTKLDVGTARQRSIAGFHSLRHSFVTICAKNEVPLPVIQELAGHGSPAIQRQYMHVGQKQTTAAITALPDFGAEQPARKADVCFTRWVAADPDGVDKG